MKVNTRFIRNLIMLTVALCLVFDVITQQVDYSYCYVYFFIEFAMIYWAVEEQAKVVTTPTKAREEYHDRRLKSFIGPLNNTYMFTIVYYDDHMREKFQEDSVVAENILFELLDKYIGSVTFDIAKTDEEAKDES